MLERTRKFLGFEELTMNQIQADVQEVISNLDLISPMRSKTVLVTGATGLIGSMLVRTFLSANAKYGLNIKVIGQIRDEEKARSIYGKLFEEAEFVKNIDVKCDYIIHTVSPTRSRFFLDHPVETIRVSVESTMEILEVAKTNQATLVYLSSMEQYGIPYEYGQRMTENDIGIIDHLNVRSSYSESKRLCECLCASYVAEYKVDVRIARLAQTFGAGVSLTDNRMPMQFAKGVSESKSIVLHTEGKNVINFVYLSDAISGILTILVKGKIGQVYNVCNDSETRSVKEIADMVASEVAGGKITVRIELEENMGYAPDVAMYLDSGKLRKLGWRSKVNMADAYCRLVRYLQEEKKG